MTVPNLTCIHSPAGLCPDCQRACDEDYRAWIEFGDYPAGIANWQALQAEMAVREDVPMPQYDDDTPF